MAKDDIEITLYTPEAPKTRYEDHVQRLIDADEKLTDAQREEGVHNSVVVTFPKFQTNKAGEQKDAVAKYTRYFQDSAKALGRTARIVETVDQGDGISVNVRFIVVEQQKRPRKPKPTAVEPSDQNDTDVPTAVQKTAA